MLSPYVVKGKLKLKEQQQHQKRFKLQKHLKSFTPGSMKQRTLGLSVNEVHKWPMWLFLQKLINKR